MPTIARIVCPGCSAALRVTLAAAARTVRCPKCQGAISVPAEGEQIPNAEPEARSAAPAKSEKGSSRPAKKESDRSEEDVPEDTESGEEGEYVVPVDPSRNWRTVRLGLLLILVSIGGQAAAALVGIVLGCLLHSALFVIVTGGISVTCRVTGIAGIALLTFTPDSYAPRKLLFMALALISMSTLYGIFNDIQSYLFLASHSQLLSADGIKKSQEEIIQKATEDAKRRAKMSPEEQKKELDKMLEEQTKQLEEIKSSGRRSPLWSLPLTVFMSLAGILLPIWYRQLAESLKEADTSERCESLIKYKLIVLAIALVTEIVTIAIFHAGLASGAGILLFAFGLMGLVVLVLAILCFVLEIQIVLGLRDRLVGKAAFRKKRKKKRQRQSP